MNVCVLGAGIVGLATAYELNRQGLQVTVVDQAMPGTGASGGNGAQLSYSYVQPLADASIWAQLPKLLLSPNSPLKIRPQWDLQQWRWGVEFLRACNSHASARTTAQLLALATASRQGVERLLASEKLVCDFSSTGKLVLYPTAKSFAAAQRQVELQRALGSQQNIITPQECSALEPALRSYQAHIAGAVHTPSECAIDCLKLCQELERLLRARGVQFQLGNSVQALIPQRGRIASVRTSKETIDADMFVMALGSDSVALARSVDVHIPVYPIKGYSITLDVDAASEGQVPHISVTDIARKVVFARIGTRLRVAGMAELVGYDRSVSPKAIASLRRSTQTLFPGIRLGQQVHPWAGLRPATPTGLPVVGIDPRGPRNLVLNTGHGALGLTLAFGTAQQVVQRILQTAPQALRT